ncbi:MAG: putative TIM-barrel fold metal-dependent hydrolase [Alphaproteobacteria bacterium]|jgi:predicted TIM-barrel fold metal-dependent hydrolase
MTSNYRVVDADAHVIETPFTFDYIEEKDRKYTPLVVNQIAGAEQKSNEGKVQSQHWIVDNNVYAKDRNVESVVSKAEWREMRDIAGRVAHMDELKIDVQVLYPTLFLRPCTDNIDVERAIFRAYNRWLADIWKKAPTRLPWAAMAPFRSPIEVIRDELIWCKENGAKSIFMRPLERETEITDPVFWPLYELAQELDLAITFHAGNGSFQVHDFFFPTSFPIHKLSMVGAFHGLLMTDLPKRFPKLRWGFIEASSQWLGYAINDATLRKRQKGVRLGDNVLRDNNIYVAVQVTDDLDYILDRYADEDFLVVGTDYGHTDTSAEIEALRMIRDDGKIPGPVVDKILGPNAARLYNLD